MNDNGDMKIKEREKQGAGVFDPTTIAAPCVSCDTEAIFSAQQIAAAKRVWVIGSGINGVAAQELLGGDGTTNQCGCGMECEVVFTGSQSYEAQWRKSRFVRGA